MSTKGRSERLPKQVENAKRGAAGSAKATAGRSRVFRDKSKYNRNEDKNVEPENVSFESREAEILKRVPSQFHGTLSLYAYQAGHAYGEGEVLSHLEELVSMLEKPIRDIQDVSYRDGYREGSNGEELYTAP